MTLMKSMKIKVLRLAILLFAAEALVMTTLLPAAASQSDSTQVAAQTSINAVELSQQGEEYILRVKCSTLPAYTVYELPKPLRLVLDIAHGVLQDSAGLPLSFNEGPVSLIQGETMADKQPALLRLTLLMAGPRSHTATREGNDIIITFATEATNISAVEVERQADSTRVLIRANGTIRQYQKEELGPDELYPARMYIDISKAVYSGPLATRKVGGALKEIRMAKRPDGVRLVFDSGLASLFSYEIAPSSQGLEVTIAEPPGGVSREGTGSSRTASGKGTAGSSGREAATLASAAPSPPSGMNRSEPEKDPSPVLKAAATAPASDSFTEAGYQNQRITVDFYKIDLHNVFRLIGDISGRNIIVDEAVGGTLTLALSDVPWDFALDTILNLKDLQKEERFNTIIIAPKSKTFHWPERKLDNLAVKADGTVTTVDSLSVQKKLETPKEVIEARRLLMAGRAADQQGDPGQALQHYEAAFAKWPGNAQLAGRLAALCLTQGGLNAKAVYYAREALRLDRRDRASALYAAIGLANMGKKQEAREYFEQAVAETADGAKPPSEALFSFAIFNEEQNNYAAAMKLLARHEQLYGDNLDTMVAAARIYDKQGNSEKAMSQYRAILSSGFELPSDLSRYIKGRLAIQETGGREPGVRAQD